MLSRGEQESFIFLRSGLRVQHQLPMPVDSQTIELPTRTIYGRASVNASLESPCWLSELGGFSLKPEDDKELFH